MKSNPPSDTSPDNSVQPLSIEAQKAMIEYLISEIKASSYPTNDREKLIRNLESVLRQNKGMLTEALKVVDTQLKDQMILLDVRMKDSNGWKSDAWENVKNKLDELEEKQSKLNEELLALEKKSVTEQLNNAHKIKSQLDGATKRLEQSKFPRYLLSLSTRLSGLTHQTTLERQEAERRVEINKIVKDMPRQPEAEPIKAQPSTQQKSSERQEAERRVEINKIVKDMPRQPEAETIKAQPSAQQKSSSSGFTFFNKAFQAARQKTRHVLDKAEEKIDKIKTSIKNRK